MEKKTGILENLEVTERIMNSYLKKAYAGKKVLVTGHTGFKGSWLTLWLAELGARVIGYSLKELPTKPSLFKTLKLEAKISHLVGDIGQKGHLQTAIKKYQPDFVFHLAAQSLVRPSYKNPILTYETNVMGTANLLESIRNVKSVKSCIIVTSDKCYKNKGLDRSFKETDSLGGYDPYSSSKAGAELVSQAYLKSFFNPKDYKKHKKAVASVRSGNVIGGGDWAEDRLVPDCVRALLNKKALAVRYPKAVRPWQHVFEPLHGYLLLAARLSYNGADFSGAWNFGPLNKDTKPVSWLVNYIVKQWKGNIKLKADNKKLLHEEYCLRLNSAKAKAKLNWKPKWSLKLALDKTIDWYKAYYEGKNMVNFSLNQIQNYQNSL